MAGYLAFRQARTLMERHGRTKVGVRAGAPMSQRDHRYNTSEKGKAPSRRYGRSLKGLAAHARYNRSEKGGAR
jgi:hypothetical protein